MPLIIIPLWKKTPILRLLFPFIAGILLQWYAGMEPRSTLQLALVCTLLLFLFFFLPFFQRHRFRFLPGILISILFTMLGVLLTWRQNIRHDDGWFGHTYNEKNRVLVVLEEAPIEKPRSFKAMASIRFLLVGDSLVQATGKLVLYFKKDSAFLPHYGQQLILRRPVQEIQNSSNPGGFNYKQYALFQGITHQVFLQPGDYDLLRDSRRSWLNGLLQTIRIWVIDVIRKTVHGKKESGLAEALLIGYKDDLDKTLVRSYTNTGVVHIIAISGLHLGLIYCLLLWLLKPLSRNKKISWLRPILLLGGLWLFSLLAGAQPSVLRSAVTFSCLVLGDCLSRRSSVYNTLAVSAFMLLCYNPFWLWDMGFQLSYAALLSILVFMRPIYNWFYIKNKFLDMLWQLNAVTIAAQILTLPVSIFQFHQFPNYFLLTNFIAVPLSSLILMGEIFLCCTSFFTPLSVWIGKMLAGLIWLMNTWIERIERLPFSVWNGLQITLFQAILLYCCIVALAYWLLRGSNRGLKWGLSIILSFLVLRSYSFLQAASQQVIIVYNIPRQRAIDFLDGRRCYYDISKALLTDKQSLQFFLLNSRTIHRSLIFSAISKEGSYCVSFANTRILVLDGSISLPENESREVIDLLLLSKNSTLRIGQLMKSHFIRQVVIDGTVSGRAAISWKNECDLLKIPFHDVSSKGAFVMNLR